MKRHTIAILAAAGFLPISGFAQPATPAVPAVPAAPAAPAAPAVPAIPPVPPRGVTKVPVTYLGVETSEVPRVVADQLGLAKGFGLVVDYVVPDGPAAAAGVQQNDIIKMINDQILVEPDQLAKLVRSYTEGTSVTLTVLRKGAETKLTAKLAKRDVPQRAERMDRMGHGQFGLGPEFEEEMKRFGEEMKNMKFTQVDEAVRAAREQARQVREQARRMRDEARRQARNSGVRVITSNDNGAMKTTRIDLGKAEIVYSDDKGEMRIQNVDGKKTLIAKDPQGRLLFSGPVTTKEEIEKVPAEVRQRYDKLEQKDLPQLAPNSVAKEDEDDNDNDMDSDDDHDSDSDNDLSDGDVVPIMAPTFAPQPAPAVHRAPSPFPYRRASINNVLI